MSKFTEGRNTLSKALEDDLAKVHDARGEIDQLVASHFDKLAPGPRRAEDSRSRPTSTGWRKPAARSTGWCRRRSAGSPRAAISSCRRWRPISPRSPRRAARSTPASSGMWQSWPKAAACCHALDADLKKVGEDRGVLDQIVAKQLERISEGRDMLARAIETDMAGLEGVVRDQIGEARRRPRRAVARPRTGYVER